MFVIYDWPFPHMCTLQRVQPICLFNSWLSFQRLCRLLWGYIYRTQCDDKQVCIDPPGITALTLLRSGTGARAAAKLLLLSIDEADGRTDTRSMHRPCTARSEQRQ